MLNEDGPEAWRVALPMIKDQVDWHELNAILEPYQMFNGMVVYEKLGVIFGTSKKTAFSMGEQYGAVRQCCISNNIRYTEVPAKKWQAEMFEGQVNIQKAGKTSRDTKAMALVAAKRLFPTVNLLMTKASSVPHDGLVDALLMAEYARRKFPR